MPLVVKSSIALHEETWQTYDAPVKPHAEWHLKPCGSHLLKRHEHHISIGRQPPGDTSPPGSVTMEKEQPAGAGYRRWALLTDALSRPARCNLVAFKTPNSACHFKCSRTAN